MNTETQLNEAWHRAAKEIIDRWVAPDMYGQAMAMLELAMKAACGNSHAQPASAGLTDDLIKDIEFGIALAGRTYPQRAEEMSLHLAEYRTLLSAAHRDSQPVADTADAWDIADAKIKASAFMQIARNSEMLFEVRDLISTITDPHAKCEGRHLVARELLPRLEKYLNEPACADASADARNAALAEVHAFLLGEGPLDGLWFGDARTDTPTKRYWWRNNLRAAIAASREKP